MAALAVGLFVLLCWAPGASAALEFCPPGEGAGQCAAPSTFSNSLRGIAVDDRAGRVYVADERNNRVDVFSEAGAFLFAFGWGVDTGAAALQKCTTASTCQKGLAGAGAGQLKEAARIAVDNSCAMHEPPLDETTTPKCSEYDPSSGDVYVAEDKNHRVQKFDPTGAFLWSVGSIGEAEGQLTNEIFPAVGPAGVVYVLDNPSLGNNSFKHRLQRFEPGGTEIPTQCFASLQSARTTGFAVEANGDFWVSSQAIRKYDAGCGPLLGPIDEGVETRFLAAGEAGGLLAEQAERGDDPFARYQVLTAYDAAGNHLRRFAYDELSNTFPFLPEGIAAAPAGVFVSVGEDGVRLLSEPPPGPLIAPSSLKASPVRSVWAAIGAEVNPEGKLTEYEVLYVDRHSFETEGGFASPKTRHSEKLELSASDFSVHAIEAAIAGCKPFSQQALEEGICLEPETEYVFKLVATNADGEDEAQGSFTTLKSFEVEALYASEVGIDGATLNAEVDPLGSPASGRFQYIDEAGYEAGIAAAEAEGMSREEAEAKGRGFDGAAEVPAGAPIDFGAGEGAVARRAQAYPLAAGTTYRYRLVAEDNFAAQASETRTFRTLSPEPSERGCANGPFRTGPSAFLPDCRAYELVSPLDKGGADIRVLPTNGRAPAVLEQSSASGDRLAFGSVRAFGDAASAPLTSQYVAQRVAGEEWQTHSIDSPRGVPIYENVLTQADTEFKFFSPDLCEAWQIPYAEPPLAPNAGAVAGFVNLYRRSDRLCGPEGYEALAPLKPLKVPGDLPPNTTFKMELQGVSADGSHAIFGSNGVLAAGGKGGAPQLYESVRGGGLRLVCLLPGGAPVSGGCTAGSRQSPGGETRGASASGAISADGRRIYWSDKESGEAKLYLRVDGTQTLAVSAQAEVQAGTKGSFFWGAAADGSRAIFTTGSLGEGKAELFGFEPEGSGGTTRLLAEGVVGVVGMSEDANRVYFVSRKALAGSAVAGKPNLYLHEAGGGGTTSFVATLAEGDLSAGLAGPAAPEPALRSSRVSPDGAHLAFTSLGAPTGYDNAALGTGAPAKEVYLYDAGSGKLLCASCNPSGARPIVAPSPEADRALSAPFAARIPGYETQMHAAHVLSDEGSRLYFESADRLSPRDSDGSVDVYEWEAPGAGSCTPSSPSYSPQDEGCVYLISSGDSPIDSRFVEATADGSDVFIATLSSLLPQDYGLIDIYDARAGGGLPVPPAAAPPCEGDSCHNPPASPVQPTPSSSHYTAPHARKGCPRGKRAVRRKGKRRCVARQKAHRKHRRHAHRSQGGAR